MHGRNIRDANVPENGDAAEPRIPRHSQVPAWQPVVCGAAAGALGWGIRGQYGHETGAMIAGMFVSLTLVLLLFRHAPAGAAIRAVAWGTVAIGFGGAMTYGQTIGLTQDAPLVGNWAALRWGLLGLAIKGALWIGFGGLFLGMGLGGKRYRPVELLSLFPILLVLYPLGVWLLNSPFDPAQRLLPALYFSDDWRWEPGAELKPRREVWGGLLFALAGAFAYIALVRQDSVARRLGAWGLLGGALGFPLGQTLQAYHAWNLDAFRTGWLAAIDPNINWWNFMETTFGAVFGAILGWGAWRNRLAFDAAVEEPAQHPTNSNERQRVQWIRSEWGLLLVGIHLVLVLVSEFGNAPILGLYTDVPLVMGILPVIAAAGQGRWAAWMIALPVTLIPIAGKTVVRLVYAQPALEPIPGWILYGILPTGVALWVAAQSARSDRPGTVAERSIAASLGLATILFFGLNFAFFRYPWPWEAWTPRTPNALVFAACAAVLLGLAGRRLLKA